MFSKIFLSVVAAGALALGGCARNYAGEGAVAGAAGGAVIGAATGGNVGEGALIGGAGWCRSRLNHQEKREVLSL